MRRLILSAATLAASLCATSSAFAAAPKTVYVRPDGKDICSGTKNLPFNITLQCAKRTIQAGVNKVAGRGTVKVAKGKYVENVTVAKSVFIVGAGKGKTIVLPAISSPDPCDDSSLCGGRASNVFLVKANDVWIQALTVNGANPAKTGVLVDGMDIDARNGIIEDHLSGVYKRLTVQDVEVKNVFLRGINSASGGGGFLFSGNTVTNVRGGDASIGIFAYGAGGAITANQVSLANDAISANQSRGVKITGNTVTQSGSGIHIDNTQPPAPGILLDLIESNTVEGCTPGGFGVWLLHPGGNVVVNDNVVTQCDVGLALLGGGDGGITFSANTVTGSGAPGTAGIYVTTDTFGWGHFWTEAFFTANTVTGFEAGAFIDQGGGASALVELDGNHLQGTLAAVENNADLVIENTCLAGSGTGLLNHDGATAFVFKSSIAGNTTAGIENLDPVIPVEAPNNWWGSADGPSPIGSGDAILGLVNAGDHLSTPPVTCN